MTRLRNREWLALAGAIGLIASVGALGIALWVSVDSAMFHFRRAAVAQAQFATALRIRGDIAAAVPDRDGLRADLARYVALVADETRLLGTAHDAAQAREAAQAAWLTRLALAPQRAVGLDRIVAGWTDRERGEATVAMREMEALQRRASLLALLLALGAAGSGLLGAIGLVAANRSLTGQVARRTAALVEVDRSRRLFFAKASHELRTPVTVMRGEAEVTLADGHASAETLRAALRQIIAQADFLEHRLAELLALSQADNGTVTLVAARFDAADAVRAACAASEGFARSLDVALAMRIEPAVVSGDRRWIEQAAVAILDNAIKFSPTGDTVTVVLRREAMHAVLTIADRGAGIVEAELPRVFDAYYQAAAGRSRGGSGLGLALAQGLVRAAGGRIGLENRPGGGAVATVEIPILDGGT